MECKYLSADSNGWRDFFTSGSDLMFLKDPSKNDFSVNGKTKSRIKIKTEQQKRIEKMI